MYNMNFLARNRIAFSAAGVVCVCVAGRASVQHAWFVLIIIAGCLPRMLHAVKRVYFLYIIYYLNIIVLKEVTTFAERI
jgi:hypothetical protein